MKKREIKQIRHIKAMIEASRRAGLIVNVSTNVGYFETAQKITEISLN